MAEKNNKEKDEGVGLPPPPGTQWFVPFAGAPPILLPFVGVEVPKARSPEAAWSPAGRSARTAAPESRTSIERVESERAMNEIIRPLEVLARAPLDIATLPFRSTTASDEEKEEDKGGGKSGVQKQKFRGQY